MRKTRSWTKRDADEKARLASWGGSSDRAHASDVRPLSFFDPTIDSCIGSVSFIRVSCYSNLCLFVDK